MRLAIVGSRNYQQPNLVVEFVNLMPAQWSLVSGRGGIVDKTAEQAIDARQMGKLIFPAEWEKYGRRAGFMRNQLIADNCDAMVAFWNEESPGTKDSIDKATTKPLYIISDKLNWRLDHFAEIIENLKKGI